MQKLTPKGKATVAGGGLAALLALATPFVIEWEGQELTPYFDSVGIETVCSGETRVVMREYTKDECAEITAKMIAEFSAYVLSVSPDIDKSLWEWLAHTSFAINNGKLAYKKSSVRKLYNSGDSVGACRFMLKYKYAGGKIITGLINRRAGHKERIGEYEACLVGAVPKAFGI